MNLKEPNKHREGNVLLKDPRSRDEGDVELGHRLDLSFVQISLWDPATG